MDDKNDMKPGATEGLASTTRAPNADGGGAEAGPGKWQGRERIQGGRTVLRRAIYMPALVAARFNPDLKTKYDQLIRRGKPAKLAITAVMRKLVVMANALLRDDRKWSEIRP
jgi:transposase